MATLDVMHLRLPKELRPHLISHSIPRVDLRYEMNAFPIQSYSLHGCFLFSMSAMDCHSNSNDVDHFLQ